MTYDAGMQVRVGTNRRGPMPGKQFYICRGSGRTVEYLLSDGSWNQQCYKGGRAVNGYYDLSEAEQMLDILGAVNVA